MSDLSAAAAAMGVPEALVQRAAAARAAETGASVEEILAAWAGGEAAPSPAEAAEAPAPVEEAPPAEAPVAEEPEPEPEPEPVPAPQPAAAAAAVRAPAPEEVTPAQLGGAPVVVTVPTAGIKERTNFAIPKWLASVLLVAPLFALFALGGSATGQCGEGTELAMDVVTGQIVNCDGTEFTGQAIGDGVADFIAMGGDIYAGAGVSGVNCSGCHAPDGTGLGQNPALTGVNTTFRSCLDHIEWVEKGSAGFQAEGRTTYGDTGKSIGGGMPAHRTLTPEQLASVAAYERVRHAGGDRDQVLADCGLVEPEEEDGENGENGEPAEEEEPPVEALSP